jgi:hypothetical protein
MMSDRDIYATANMPGEAVRRRRCDASGDARMWLEADEIFVI